MLIFSFPLMKQSFRLFIEKHFSTRPSFEKSVYGVTYDIPYNPDYPNRKRNCLTFYVGDKYLEIRLPGIFKPALVDRGPRNAVILSREYGCKVNNHQLRIFYGVQNYFDFAGVSNKCKTFNFKWQDRETTSLCILDPDTMSVVKEFIGSGMTYTQFSEFQKSLNKPSFQVMDYDGETTNATLIVERHIVEKGSGLFKYLRIFRKPKVEVSIKLTFDKYIGVEKHTWKGGSAGAVIELSENETVNEGLDKFFKNPSKFNREFSQLTRI